jgi:hypothetical protein
MPTGLHMSVIPWLKNEFFRAGQSGFFSASENDTLTMSSSTSMLCPLCFLNI